MRNVIFGVLMVAGGLSGKLVLIGTNSSTALTIVGVVIAAFGLFQLLAGNKNETAPVRVENPGTEK